MQNTHLSATDSTLLETTRPLIVRAADVPLVHGIPNESNAFPLTAAITGGLATVAKAVVGVNGGPPPHVHANEEEIFVVQSGAFEMLVNGQLVEARAGDVAYMARGEAHRFRGLDSGEENRFFIILAPSGFEEFMARWIPLFKDGAPDMGQAVSLCGEYGIEIYPSDDLTPPVPANPQTRVVGKDEKKPLYFAGTKITILLDSSETQGRYTLIRVEGPENAGPPVHVHTLEDELFIVEEGSVEFTLGDEKVIAQAGDMVWGPRYHPHTFRIASEYARIVAFKTPGGFEDYFVQAADMEAKGGVDLAALIELSARFGMTFPAFQ